MVKKTIMMMKKNSIMFIKKMIHCQFNPNLHKNKLYKDNNINNNNQQIYNQIGSKILTNLLNFKSNLLKQLCPNFLISLEIQELNKLLIWLGKLSNTMNNKTEIQHNMIELYQVMNKFWRVFQILLRSSQI